MVSMVIASPCLLCKVLSYVTIPPSLPRTQRIFLVKVFSSHQRTSLFHSSPTEMRRYLSTFLCLSPWWGYFGYLIVSLRGLALKFQQNPTIRHSITIKWWTPSSLHEPPSVPPFLLSLFSVSIYAFYKIGHKHSCLRSHPKFALQHSDISHSSKVCSLRDLSLWYRSKGEKQELTTL